MGILLSAFMEFSRLFMDQREAQIIILVSALVSVALDWVVLAFIYLSSMLFNILFAN